MRFPDEVVFDDSIKEADGDMILSMLRRVSLDINVNRINMAGMTALHQVSRTRGERLLQTLTLIGQEVQLSSSCPTRATGRYLLSNQSMSLQ